MTVALTSKAVAEAEWTWPPTLVCAADLRREGEVVAGWLVVAHYGWDYVPRVGELVPALIVAADMPRGEWRVE